MTEPLLSIRNFSVDYITDRGPVRAIDNVSLDVRPGEILGVAGESGSGKSTLAKAVMRILPPPAVISGGQVTFEGRDVMTLNGDELRSLRWQRISMVFQSAMNSLNPVISVGEQITDTIRAHSDASHSEARARAEVLLDTVGIPRRRLGSFAHQLSGGMRQRIGIALALTLEPSLVILDEPTTALDVIVEREILEQILALQRSQGFAVMFITHDIARMMQVADRVAVFYAAQLVEIGPVDEVRRAPVHPYTRGLLHAAPSMSAPGEEPQSIPGVPPSLENPPSGCRFHPRCDLVIDQCRIEEPESRTVGPAHRAACHKA
jgi:peptide/nickel transport system ATP-binding protein